MATQFSRRGGGVVVLLGQITNGVYIEVYTAYIYYVLLYTHIQYHSSSSSVCSIHLLSIILSIYLEARIAHSLPSNSPLGSIPTSPMGGGEDALYTSPGLYIYVSL